MSTEKISFKENPRAGNLGLEKEENGSRSKFPGCYDFLQPAKGRDGRWITGLDEDSFKVSSITNQSERKATYDKIKAERENLERLMGLDLSGNSEYWNTYVVAIDTTKPLDLAIPQDLIAFRVIISNNGAAPSLKASKSGDFVHRSSKYFISRENEDVADKVAIKKLYNKAILLFTELIEDPDKTFLVAKYLNLPITESTPQNNRFDIIQNFLDKDEQYGSIAKFLIAIEKSPEELNLKLIFDDAVKFKVIMYDGKTGLYQRGIVTFGNNPKKAMETLGNPEMSGELNSIIEEIDYKRKFA